MKLYLSSYRIQHFDALTDLVGKEAEAISVGLVPNAKDYYADRARAYKIGQITEYLTSLHLSSQIVDLRDYNHGQTLQDDLSHFDMLWVMGGNTFCLMQEMKRSKFSEIIGNVLESGVTYCGESAGAVVAGTTLRGVELADVPEFAEEVIWDGLALVPNFIMPHADSADFAEAITAAKEAHRDDADAIFLNDNQALIVNGLTKSIVTAS